MSSNVEILYALLAQYTKIIEYDGNNNAIYVCEAQPGTIESASEWRIYKITYDVNNNATNIQWASGNAQFDKVYNDRASYDYS